MGVLQHIEHQISALNDLIKINNDRIAGYQKANGNTKETGLNLLFTEYMDQSKRNVSELNDYIQVLGGDPTDGTTLSGKISNTWIDVKAAFAGKDRHSILSDCERAEDVIKKSYRAALDDKELIWEDQQVVFILKKHLESFGVAHDTIKALRDTAMSA